MSLDAVRGNLPDDTGRCYRFYGSAGQEIPDIHQFFDKKKALPRMAKQSWGKIHR